MLVPILLGSAIDKEFAEKITTKLDMWGIPSKVMVASAHKVPERVFKIVSDYNKSDEDIVYVTIAGRSNGLSGVTAANSIHPVIACPPFKDKDDMWVNIHSTLQMPSDTPAITVLDPQNVVMAIVRIFALNNKDLKKKLEEHIKNLKSQFD